MLNSVSPLFKQFSKPLGTEEVDSDVGSATESNKREGKELVLWISAH